MQDDELEPAEQQEVVEVVTTAKLMTEVVTVAATITAVATSALTITTAASDARKRKGVNINWDDVIEQVQRKEKEYNVVMRYQALKRKPQIEVQARKNVMIYLRNIAGFKMDYFKGMSYDDIRLIFEKYFNSNVVFLEKTKEQLKEDESRALKRKTKSYKEKVAKKQKLDEEVEKLRKHLQIVPNDEDDIYTEATPLARKVPVVDYEIYTKNNKLYYKIMRADDTHQLFLSFLSLLRNFDREDLEVLWQIVKERFASSRPKNFSNEFLLTTLTYMFEKPDVEAQVWKNQRSVYGLEKVKSWRLLESCGVHVITFITTQMILLVERRYPLTSFTLDQMLNNIRLEVEEESKVSLELLRFVRQQQQEGFRPESCKDSVSEKEAQASVETNLMSNVDINAVKVNSTSQGVNDNKCINTIDEIRPIPMPDSENLVLSSRNCGIDVNGDNADNGSGVRDEVIKESPVGMKHVSFINAVQGANKASSNKLKLVSVCVNDQGKRVVDMDPLIEKGSKNWSMTLVGYFVRLKMSHREILGMQYVLENGPWMVDGLPLFIQKWEVRMCMSKPEPKKVPLWVKIYDIPLEAWNSDDISRISSMIGNPIIMDRITIEMCDRSYGRASFARVLIEVDADLGLIDKVGVFGHGLDSDIGWKTVNNRKSGRNDDTNGGMYRQRNYYEAGSIRGGLNGRGRGGMNGRGVSDQRFNNNVGARYVPVKKNKAVGPVNDKESDKNKKSKDKIIEGKFSMDKGIETEMLSERMNVDERVFSSTIKIKNRGGKNINEEDRSSKGNAKKEEKLGFFINSISKEAYEEMVNQIGMENYEDINEEVVEDHSGCRIAAGWDPLVRSLLDNKLLHVSVIYDEITPKSRSRLWRNLRDHMILLENVDVKGFAMFRLAKRLKFMKKHMRDLNRKNRDVFDKVNFLRTELGRIQQCLDKDLSNTALREEEIIYASAFKDAALDEEKVLQQKTKITWLKDGDFNSSDEIANIFVSHFMSFLGTQDVVYKVEDADSLFTKRLDADAALDLIKPVDDKEIKEALFSIDDNKASGLDGYYLKFFKATWSVIGSDLCSATKEFFVKGKLLSEFNTTLISFVPKVKSPAKVIDYRTISCCNVVYKVIIKVFTNRPKLVLNDLVDVNQSAFIPGRQSSDNVLLAQEFMRNYTWGNMAKNCAFKTGEAFFCGLTPEIKNDILMAMLFKEGNLPIKYLGVPFVFKKINVNDCKILIEVIQNRIND
nr:hypothetical protein [Tanacetum cinerariifolium]